MTTYTLIYMLQGGAPVEVEIRADDAACALGSLIDQLSDDTTSPTFEFVHIVKGQWRLPRISDVGKRWVDSGPIDDMGWTKDAHVIRPMAARHHDPVQINRATRKRGAVRPLPAPLPQVTAAYLRGLNPPPEES